MAEEDTGDRKEGESEESGQRGPSERDPSNIDFPDDVELEFSGEAVPDPPDEDETTPEERAQQVADEYETPPEQPSEEEPPEEDVTEEPEAEEEPPSEEEETPPEEEPAEPEEPSEVEESPEEEPSPEDLAREVTEGLEEEAAEEEEVEEEGEEETVEEATEEPPEEQPEPTPEEEPEEKDELDEIAEEVLEEEEEEVPEAGDEGMVTFEGDPEDLATGEEEEGEGSIQDMLEEEAEKAREGEEEAEEEELPEDYLTVEQLPEHEEFEVPAWARKSGWALLIAGCSLLLLWYFLMPLWEVFLTNQIDRDIVTKDYESAESWVRWGLALQGSTIRYDDAFLAHYLKRLLDEGKLKRFREEYRKLHSEPPGPNVLQTYIEYLVMRGDWEQVREKSARLQQFPSNRGIAYLFHGKAMLELGDLQFARSDVDRASNWIGDHPGILRVERDLLMERGQYDGALDRANELRNLVQKETNDYQIKVTDFVQLARIHRNLGKHRVAQRMLERALDLDADNKEALRELSSQYVLEHRWEAAERLVEGEERKGYRQLYPFDSLGWWTASEVSTAQGDLNKGIRLVERANNLEPRSPEVRRVFGEIYLNQLNEPDLAVKHLELSEKYGMNRLRFKNVLGKAYYQKGEFIKAAESYETLKDNLGDTRPGLYYNIGTSYLAARQFDRAEKNLQKARDLGYENEDLFNQWGLMLELRGNSQEAYGKYFEGIQWGEQNDKPVDKVRSNLNRLLEGRDPEPIQEWLAPLRTDIEIPYWKRVKNN